MAIFSWCNNPRPIRIEQDIRAIIKSSLPGTPVGCPFDNVINVINVTQKPLMDVILWGMADSRTTSTSEAELFKAHILQNTGGIKMSEWWSVFMG